MIQVEFFMVEFTFRNWGTVEYDINKGSAVGTAANGIDAPLGRKGPGMMKWLETNKFN